MRAITLFLILAAAASAIPAFTGPRSSKPMDSSGMNMQWPSRFEGAALRELALSDRERSFAEGFPGRTARFTDGRRELIIRWVTRETNEVHSAATCLQATGYTIVPRPMTIDSAGLRWSRFEASRDGERLDVRERIADESGNQWTDLSAWYWAALLGDTSGPWWSWVVAEKVEESRSRGVKNNRDNTSRNGDQRPPNI
jgi:hypothetical protein